jgi:hypothetical protein
MSESPIGFPWTILSLSNQSKSLKVASIQVLNNYLVLKSCGDNTGETGQTIKSVI